MPYDPKPVSEGGNRRGIDERFSRHAPAGKFRVVGVDTFDNTDWVQGDFDTLKEALNVANEEGGAMTKMYVYNEYGGCIYEAGVF